jgi:hypothetical protein
MTFGPKASLDQVKRCILMPVQTGKWNYKLHIILHFFKIQQKQILFWSLHAL